MFSKTLLIFIGTAFIIGFANGSSSNEVEGSSEVSYEVRKQTRKRVLEALDLENWKTIKQWHNVSLDVQFLESEGRLFGKYVGMINQDCVDEKINFSKFGENKLNYTMALRLFGSANVLCMEKNGKRIIDVITKEFLEELFQGETKIRTIKEYRDCFSKKLKELNPTSKLVENFDENTMTHNSEECDKTLDVKGQIKNTQVFERFFGDFSSAFCGHVTKDDYLRVVFSSPFMILEENEELKKVEKQKIDEFIETSINELYECTLKNLL